MKNLIKFLLFVVLVSAGISALYDYRIKTGGLKFLAVATEKYSLATTPTVDPKDVAGLENLNRERRALVSAIIPSVVSIKTSKKVAVRKQYQLDPGDFFNRNPRQFRNPNEEAMVQNSLGSGVVVTSEGHIITNNHVVDQVDEIEVQLSDGRTKKARLVGSDAVVDLAVLENTTDGFAVAEADWEMRGPGDLLGTAQSGLPALKLGNLKTDAELMRRARASATAILGADPRLEAPENQRFRQLIVEQHGRTFSNVS